MTYEETLDFLFNRLQSFHNSGAVAYKPGLEKAFALADAFGNPHKKFRTIHVGGTNGKGSTSHSIASVLMAAGLKVGLYTSPHLVDFRERIRTNGKTISEQEVVDFVEQYLSNPDVPEDCDPSFFELTTIMAFRHFARQAVDVAVIEVGLGGRLDTTNIITPELSVITNISPDHTNLLGNTLAAIATEKAGIIKPGVPVVIGRRGTETDHVFAEAAKRNNAPITFAQDNTMFADIIRKNGRTIYENTPWGRIEADLTGDCQPENMATVLNALKILIGKSFPQVSAEAVRSGLSRVCSSTGLMGRWMTIRKDPEVIADTAHNPDGWKFLSARLRDEAAKRKLHMVIGFVGDKDYGAILRSCPTNASYYIVRPGVERAADTTDVARKAREAGLTDVAVYSDVLSGYTAALARAQSDGQDCLVFVGGSTFVVADLLTALSGRQ